MDPALVHGLTTHRASPLSFFDICLPRLVSSGTLCPGGLNNPFGRLCCLFFCPDVFPLEDSAPRRGHVSPDYLMALQRRSPSLRFLCFAALVGKGRKKYHMNTSAGKIFLLKSWVKCNWVSNWARRTKGMSWGGKWSQGVPSFLSVPREPSIAPPST